MGIDQTHQCHRPREPLERLEARRLGKFPRTVEEDSRSLPSLRRIVSTLDLQGEPPVHLFLLTLIEGMGGRPAPKPSTND